MGLPNKDEVKGKLKQAKGSIKKNVGDVLNDREMEAEGSADRAKGRVQEGFGKAKRRIGEAIEDVGKAVRK